MSITLTTQHTPRGILCLDKHGNEVALIVYDGDSHTWSLESEAFRLTCSFLKRVNFFSLESAQYAALIIAEELVATGH